MARGIKNTLIVTRSSLGITKVAFIGEVQSIYYKSYWRLTLSISCNFCLELLKKFTNAFTEYAGS